MNMDEIWNQVFQDKIFETAVNAVKEEYDYAKKKWNSETTTSGGNPSPAEFLLYISHYVHLATTHATQVPDPESTRLVQDAMRKIANLAITSMIQNGIVERTP
ncbi:hypothetical protein EVB81_227 [Rhizobium phage RHph_I46]|uniref:Uncharacterized protein n=1 Tax=Rhizobium phage RHph_I1_9 TaxID=2509729 RepID=A0A7S5R9M5_9CAUD|nr:hypothetical protein PP936_gp225 [Rhizobium phage RHph_I1_9]QIG69796.1 hypothetical protein EVB81_227 [Rhizobium phage RHph_I46]QIG71077.1 hypothetical protein EVB92_227 [Rhizobium phage RHph_I9]QIG73662.1 hypothetical protein EVC04_225 [Rhizobium phage RHph_I1_9]QIG76416.1 hypothetical protein EVC25_227 [Rhizobium phage RHph_I34]